MTNALSIELLLQALLWLAVGTILGTVFFASLGRTLALYEGGRPLAAALIHLGRIAVMVGVLVVAVRFGAESLLATALGILVGRWLVLRRVRKELP